MEIRFEVRFDPQANPPLQITGPMELNPFVVASLCSQVATAVLLNNTANSNGLIIPGSHVVPFKKV